jgi:hypothetical protein
MNVVRIGTSVVAGLVLMAAGCATTGQPRTIASLPGSILTGYTATSSIGERYVVLAVDPAACEELRTGDPRSGSKTSPCSRVAVSMGSTHWAVRVIFRYYYAEVFYLTPTREACEEYRKKQASGYGLSPETRCEPISLSGV